MNLFMCYFSVLRNSLSLSEIVYYIILVHLFVVHYYNHTF